MNKKVMALAVAGVLTAPAAFAQSSNVQLYGRAVLGIDSYGAEGSVNGATDYQNRLRVFDNSSRVGLRGTEDLGNGLKAIFQIETGVAVDSGSTQGAGGVGNASKGTWASRDSFVGLDSGFGRLTFGRQSIYWANGELAQFSANYINTEIPWTNGTMMGRISRATGGAGPVARQSNTVQYTTPTFAGFNATLSYSPNAQESVQHNSCVAATNTTLNPASVAGTQNAQVSGLTTLTSSNVTTTGTSCAVGTGSDADGQIWGATIRGRFANFHGQFDYVKNENNSGISGVTPATLAPINTAPQAEFTGYKAGIGWKYMPGANVSFIWVRSESNNALGVTRGVEVTQNGYTVNWEHTFGNVQVLAQYGWTDSMKGCTGAITATNLSCGDTKASAYMLGARYLLSKRTWVFASYNLIDNQQNQFADFTGDAYTSVAGNGPVLTPYGADPEVWALGIFHAF
jgi:predicted porin